MIISYISSVYALFFSAITSVLSLWVWSISRTYLGPPEKNLLVWLWKWLPRPPHRHTFFLVEFLPQLTQHRTRFLVQCKIKGGFIRPRLVEQTFYYIIKYEMHFEQEREFGNSEYISAYQTLLGLASGHGGILIQLQVSFGWLLDGIAFIIIILFL